MIWILALLVMAAGVGLGLNLGAIPNAFSFIGIVMGTWCANLFGKLFKWLLLHFLGVTNPVYLWAIPPILGFLLVWVIFMAIGIEVHRRVGVFYKYKAGDLRLRLWERLNFRLGACLGILNGACWLVLVSFLIFNYSYVTAQVAPSEGEGKITRLMNNLGEGLQSTGLNKAGRAVGSVPDTFYKTSDFFGLLAQNPDTSSRLATYPALISLGERNDIQSLGGDSSLGQAWKSGTPMGAVLSDTQIQNMLKDTNLVTVAWNLLQANMDDLTNYLVTGKSPKYDSEKIVGHWGFDVVPALAAFREANPKIKPNEMKALRGLWNTSFAQTTFVAGTDGQAFVKNVPDFKSKPPAMNNWQGQWVGVDTNYSLTFSLNGHNASATAVTDGLRLTIKTDGTTYVFDRIN
jgi:hypothetical protein